MWARRQAAIVPALVALEFIVRYRQPISPNAAKQSCSFHKHLLRQHPIRLDATLGDIRRDEHGDYWLHVLEGRDAGRREPCNALRVEPTVDRVLRPRRLDKTRLHPRERLVLPLA
jgi:hypothetical protein